MISKGWAARGEPQVTPEASGWSSRKKNVCCFYGGGISATNKIMPFLDSNDASQGKEVQEEDEEDRTGHKKHHADSNW